MSDRRTSMQRQQRSDSMIGDGRSYEMRCDADAEMDGDRGRDYLFAPLFCRVRCVVVVDGIYCRPARRALGLDEMVQC